MLAKIEVGVVTAIATVLAVESASADSGAIYNVVCREEVAAFQQASNADDITTTRHELLLCLADDAYAESNQADSEYAQWTDAKHLQVFATEPEVKLGDTVYAGIFPQAEQQTSKNFGVGAALSGGVEQCTCPVRNVTRAPGDPTDPLKSEGLDIYFTMNLGNLMADGADGFDQMKGFLDQVQAIGAMPLVSDQRAANVIARFGDFGRTGVGVPHNPTGSTGRSIEHLWNPQGAIDWSSVTMRQQSRVDNLGSACACPQYRIPVDRSGGDGVPYTWREADDYFFSTTNPRGLIESLPSYGVDLDVLQGRMEQQ